MSYEEEEREIHACQMRRRIHASHMRRRIHACHMRRRIHASHMRRRIPVVMHAATQTQHLVRGNVFLFLTNHCPCHGSRGRRPGSTLAARGPCGLLPFGGLLSARAAAGERLPLHHCPALVMARHDGRQRFETLRLPHPQCPRKFWCIHLHDEDWLDERLGQQGACQVRRDEAGMPSSRERHPPRLMCVLIEQSRQNPVRGQTLGISSP
jgi:hypothetical protein